MSEDELEKYGFTRMVYQLNKYRTKTILSKGELICEYDLKGITHKNKGKEISREEFFELATK